MNFLDQLQGLEAIQLEKTADYKLLKLSEALGSDVLITVNEISPSRMNELTLKSMEGIKGGIGEKFENIKIDIAATSNKEFKTVYAIIAEGWKESTSKEVLKKFGVQNYTQLFDKILSRDDIANLFDLIKKISGVTSEEKVEDVKKQ